MSIQIDSEFPGGNIVVEELAGDEVRMHQDLRDTDRAWFYWCFRVRGAEGRTLRFRFTTSRAIGARGPGVSLDGGRSWRWLGADAVQDNGFAYTFSPQVPEVRFSFGMPYQTADWRAFVERLPASFRRIETPLCRSRQGRPVELLRTDETDAPRYRVAITARHHCCEMMANYTLEGLVGWCADAAEAASRWLRENAGFFIVPFADTDGVENGDQGKGRRLRDHGRDYLDESLFPETAAIREQLPRWGDGRLRVGLDLHCPWIAGAHNEVIYQVGAGDEQTAAEQRRFSALLEATAAGPLPFRPADYLPFGTAWNIADNYAGGKSFARWVRELPGVALGTAIEIPYANAGGAEVNADTARAFGRDLGRALAAYLR